MSQKKKFANKAKLLMWCKRVWSRGRSW